MPAKPARRYELKERARRQEETRQRIVEATVALHEEVGPARTTVAEVARRAGVQRLTVYNHFPDDAALIGACSAHFLAGHPLPDPGPWTAVRDPAARLRQALEELYARHRATEAMTANVLRDAEIVPALGAIIAGGREAYEGAVTDILLAGRGVRGARKRRTPPRSAWPSRSRRGASSCARAACRTPRRSTSPAASSRPPSAAPARRSAAARRPAR